MPGAAEEAGEEVERIVSGAAGAALLAVLGETLMTVLVVNTAGFRGGESFVGVGDLDKEFVGGVVAAVCIFVVSICAESDRSLATTAIVRG